MRTTPRKSPASRDRDAESAVLGPDRGGGGARYVIAVLEGRKRGTAYSEAAVLAIGLGGNENALLAEGVFSQHVRWRTSRRARTGLHFFGFRDCGAEVIGNVGNRRRGLPSSRVAVTCTGGWGQNCA